VCKAHSWVAGYKNKQALLTESFQSCRGYSVFFGFLKIIHVHQGKMENGEKHTHIGFISNSL